MKLHEKSTIINLFSKTCISVLFNTYIDRRAINLQKMFIKSLASPRVVHGEKIF